MSAPRQQRRTETPVLQNKTGKNSVATRRTVARSFVATRCNMPRRCVATCCCTSSAADANVAGAPMPPVHIMDHPHCTLPTITRRSATAAYRYAARRGRRRSWAAGRRGRNRSCRRAPLVGATPARLHRAETRTEPMRMRFATSGKNRSQRMRFGLDC